MDKYRYAVNRLLKKTIVSIASKRPASLKKILYISYDGLTDSLGQSQILPYLEGLSKYEFQFFVLSFEKRGRYHKEKETVKNITDAAGIKWIPLWFTARPPVLSKIYDRWRLKKTALKLNRRHKFDMVHCRSYVAAEVGLYFKRKFGTKFLFDMRGFWADEKKDSGAWDQRNPFFRQVYKYYKQEETLYLKNADEIVTLTEAAKREMKKWPVYDPEVPLRIIPCCADMNHFSLTDQEQKFEARKRMGLSQDGLILSYLGSVGTWYMLDEMLAFFKKVKANFSSAKFLFITQTPPIIIEDKIKDLELDREDFVIAEAARSEVPAMVKASDVNISFIKPVYSKISSSPTKLGEVLSMGIPVICNSGVGDVESIVTNANAGHVLAGFSESDYKEAVNAIPELLKKSPSDIRNRIKDIFSLEKGIDSYLLCYRHIFSQAV